MFPSAQIIGVSQEKGSIKVFTPFGIGGRRLRKDRGPALPTAAEESNEKPNLAGRELAPRADNPLTSPPSRPRPYLVLPFLRHFREVAVVAVVGDELLPPLPEHQRQHQHERARSGSGKTPTSPPPVPRGFAALRPPRSAATRPRTTPPEPSTPPGRRQTSRPSRTAKGLSLYQVPVSNWQAEPSTPPNNDLERSSDPF
jgi:hypothetical protein